MNLLLDFTHICPPDVEQRVPGMKRIDLSDIPGTCMYCADEAKRQLRERLNDYGPHGIHFLDNGNYHYMTELFAEKIRAPFALEAQRHAHAEPKSGRPFGLPRRRADAGAATANRLRPRALPARHPARP